MQGVEIGHCDAAINAVLTANYTLLGTTVEDALKKVDTYGKNDTLGLDARPEIDIVQIMKTHDDNSIVITEELGSKGNLVFNVTEDPRAQRTIYLSDPTDRSAPLKTFLAKVDDKSLKLKDVIQNPNTIPDWEKHAGSPASITGAFCALSCIRHAVPIFSVLVNYITQELFVSCSAGNYQLAIPEERPPIDLQYVTNYGKKLFFPAIRCPYNDDARRFVTFVGKEGYEENLLASHLMSKGEIDRLLHYREPGGPSRILYLSGLQPKESTIGFVYANGEKITEWFHWISWVMNARKENDQGENALSLFEVYHIDQVRMKDKVLMSTPPSYSIFKRAGEDDRMIINIGRFSDFDNPSRIRGTLIACPTGNTWATGLVKQFGYRPITF